MEWLDVIGLLVVGVAAGALGGLVGVGGGVLFVPGLSVFLDQSHLDAEATSLVAVVLVALAGAWRQRGYGNLRLQDALLIGVLSPLGAVTGAVLANAVPERGLELSFAALQLYFAYRLLRRALAPAEESGPAGA